MAKVTLKVNDASASAIVDGKLTASAVGVPIELQITGDRWAGLSAKIICSCGNVDKQMIPVDNNSYIPHECLIAGKLLRIGVDGISTDGKTRIPTIWASCGIVASSVADADPATPVTPTPDAVAQILTKAQSAETKAQSVVDRANAGEFDGADGADGAAGQPGADGQPGRDGISPTVTITDIANGKRITITDASGAHTADILNGADGADGQPGRDGSDAEVTAQNIGNALGYTPADAATLAEVDEHIATEVDPAIEELNRDLVNKLDAPSNPLVGKYLKISAVNADGSVVLENVDLPIASETNKLGLMKVGTLNESGLSINTSGQIAVEACANSQIDARNTGVRPIVPSNLVRAVDSVLCSTAESEQLDADKQLAARQRIGAVPSSWQKLIDITTTSDMQTCSESFGKAYTEAYAEIEFAPASQVGRAYFAFTNTIWSGSIVIPSAIGTSKKYIGVRGTNIDGKTLIDCHTTTGSNRDSTGYLVSNYGARNHTLNGFAIYTDTGDKIIPSGTKITIYVR